MRYAIYFTNTSADPLTAAGSRWLGRDAFSGEILAQPQLTGIDDTAFHEKTASARRYGFHATIVAPFRPRAEVSEMEIVKRLRKFCARHAPFDFRALAPHSLHNFVALQDPVQAGVLGAIASHAVEFFDDMRAPLTDAEISKRDPARLSQRQCALLKRWGYPYVMEEFRFHMTLAGPLDAQERELYCRAAQHYFAPVLEKPMQFKGLALFSETGEPGAAGAFTIAEYVPLGAAIESMDDG